MTPNAQPKWKRIQTKVNYWFQDVGEDLPQKFMLSFTHTFNYPAEEETFFAFSPPFSFQDSVELMDQIEQKLKPHPNIYICREVLCYSLEGRPMEVVTISSRDGMVEQTEPAPEDKECLVFPYGSSCNRFPEKKVVFLTSRVHPGEAPGSHALNGFLQLLSE